MTRRAASHVYKHSSSVRSSPQTESFANLNHLQQTVGNRASHGLLSRIQRKCACDGAEENCAECQEKSESAPPIVDTVLRSPGQPLERETRAMMESRFDHDFSGVRVHTDDRAAQSARAVNALAFTVGQNVVFSEGQYNPRSAAGQRLIAHELTHVVQQQGSDQMQRYASVTSGRVLQRAAIYTGRILDEGSCKFLVANSKWICCDPDKGFERKGKKKDIDGNDCESEKFSPIFTCDNNCTNAVAKGCSDSDNWMALPKSRFANRKCGQDLVICANESFTHAYVRDKSEREAWEVSKAIPAALGVSPDFSGAIYPDESDAAFLKDKRCRKSAATTPATPAKPTEKEKE